MRDRLLDSYGLRAAFDGKTRQIAASLDVGGDGDDVERLIAQHLLCVGVESVNAISITECLEPLGVAFRSGHDLNAGTVMENLGPGVGYIRPADVLVIVELAVNV